MQQSEKHVVWHETLVSQSDRNRLNNHKSGLIWLTGLSASGKSTVAHGVERVLHDRGVRTYVLDGDNIRHGLNSNLGFSAEDRKENMRRVMEVARLFVDAGIVVLAAFISPYREDRDLIRSKFEQGSFLEIYVRCGLEECERRDPKGLYKKARAGVIKNYTGIDAPYEEPLSPELVLDTTDCSVDTSIHQVVELLETSSFVPANVPVSPVPDRENAAYRLVFSKIKALFA